MKVRHDKNADAVMITLNNRTSKYGKRVLPDASEHITSQLPERPLNRPE